MLNLGLMQILMQCFVRSTYENDLLRHDSKEKGAKANLVGVEQCHGKSRAGQGTQSLKHLADGVMPVCSLC